VMILSLLSFILIDAWCLFVYVCNERKNEENEEEEEEEEDVCGSPDGLYPEIPNPNK
jgi:large-conductance mechanosensitive channel